VCLELGDASETYACPANTYISLGQIRFAFRAGKNEADLNPNSIRMLTATDLQDIAQSIRALISTTANNGTTYYNGFQQQAYFTGNDTLSTPVIAYPGSIYPVTNITDVVDIALAETPLTLNGTVTPNNATNKNITWSIKNAGATGASINGNIFSATSAGSAVITATITDGVAIGTDFIKDFNITVYNYSVYLETAQTTYTAGETVYADLKLLGNLNYTQIAAEIAYDTNLLTFAGYENLAGYIAAVNTVTPNNISIQSIPTSNMLSGAPCSPAVKIVTLKFTVNNNSTGTDTDITFNSITVAPTAGVVGATTAPGKPLTITVNL
jgi:hypothetical protein